MKRALVLTYDYPPCSAPGAALRSERLVRYLPEFGWEARVICRLEAGPAIEEAPGAGAPDVIRLGPVIPERVSYQLASWAWARRMLARAAAVVRDWGPDLIYVSCPPFAHAVPSVRLARRSGLPLVMDFRDAWSLDPYASGGWIKQTAKRALCRWVFPPLERKAFAAADAILLNTPSMRRAYVRTYPAAHARIHLVPNGFDDTDFSEPAARPPRARPQLLYCGRFTGVGGRSPDLLLRGVRDALDAGRRFDLDILGDDGAELRESIRRFGLQEAVRLHPRVPHREAVRAAREADVLVVCQAPGRNDVTAVAGKTFEYLRSGRPILALVPPGDNADLIRRYAAVHAVVADAAPAVVAAAIGMLLDRAAGSEVAVDPAFVMDYSRRNIAGRIAAVFDAVTGPAGSFVGQQE
jgi:glycosyltransferase involved in cell wall biosynthesis